MLPLPLLIQLHGNCVGGIHDRSAQHQQNCLNSLRGHDRPWAEARCFFLLSNGMLADLCESEVGGSLEHQVRNDVNRIDDMWGVAEREQLYRSGRALCR